VRLEEIRETAQPRQLAYTKDAHLYDQRTRVFQDFRRAIVDTLPLRPGDMVLDVGCGTGLCFPMLIEKVGVRGHIVGIDASPDMVVVARQRVAREGWRNVTVIESPVANAQIPVGADAALFCAVHDILQSPEALRKIVDSLRPGGWVAAGGGKWAAAWLVALNWQVRALHAPYVTDFEGFDRPWGHLECLVEGLQVHDLAFGTGYVATGRVRPKNRSRPVVAVQELARGGQER
jgi:demethylmenaquinone methyltransferase/2-methoxy-6-polyprenyl-1,4-benzoquinol methylase